VFEVDSSKSAEWNRGAYLGSRSRSLRRLPHAPQRLRCGEPEPRPRWGPHSDAELVCASL
jgi:hypothetical protein